MLAEAQRRGSAAAVVIWTPSLSSEYMRSNLYRTHCTCGSRTVPGSLHSTQMIGSMVFLLNSPLMQKRKGHWRMQTRCSLALNGHAETWTSNQPSGFETTQ